MKLTRNAKVFRPGRALVWPKGHNPISKPEYMSCTCDKWLSAAGTSDERWSEFEEHVAEKRRK